MSGIATIVAIVARTKRKLKEAGATSEETAKTPKELDLNEKWLKNDCSRRCRCDTGRPILYNQQKRKATLLDESNLFFEQALNNPTPTHIVTLAI